MRIIKYCNLLALTVLFSCNSGKSKNENTQHGVLNHKFSISPLARDSFDKGLLLLHSFEYEDAREAFREASRHDTNELMAYWGEAMSFYKALWGLQNIDSGRAVLDKVGSSKEVRMAKSENELEADFWEGVEILYGEGDLSERNTAYADHMEALYNKYTINQEVAAFYALGLMWSADEGRDSVLFDKSASIAAGILKENPGHPGALHYLIHANDDPNYAKLSKEAADMYSKVAPDATHALHMPSHIYLALGMWNDVVASNEASYAASVARMHRKGLGDEARGYHSFRWLHYGYLQQGNYKKAEALLRDMMVYTQRTAESNSRGYLISMQNAQKVESGEWPDNIEPVSIDDSQLGLTSQAEQHFFKALMSFDNKRKKTILTEIDSLQDKIAEAELIVDENVIAVCSSGATRYSPSRSSIYKANVILNEMNAMIAVINGNEMLAEQYLIRATQLEDQAGYSYGPPDIPYPSYEMYADWLMDNNRMEDALVQYDRSLAAARNRTRSLIGKSKALVALGRNKEAEKVNELLSSFI